MRNDKSPHILNASSNLLGLCFVVLTSLKFLKLAERTLIDEAVAIAILFFMLSCVLSFLAIRGSLKAGKYEDIADFIFLGGLLILFATAVLLLLNFIN